jgi:hypothetical protein
MQLSSMLAMSPPFKLYYLSEMSFAYAISARLKDSEYEVFMNFETVLISSVTND